MTSDIAFLTVEQLLAVHRRVIDEFGGTYELRARGFLESAAAMPAARLGGRYLHQGVPAMAAAYLFHICKNHPFVDGNKRTAVAAAELFLRANGWSLSATDDELEQLTLGAADGTISKEQTLAFFEQHTTLGENQ